AADGGPAPALDLSPEVPALVTDAERLRTALVNILANARDAVRNARVAPAGMAAPESSGSPASLVLDGAAVFLRTSLENGRAVVVVRASGSGIDPAALPHIFDPYFTTRRGGTGLGLPIAKNIIEGLGGTLTARSTDSGTEIRIELPVRAGAFA